MTAILTLTMNPSIDISTSIGKVVPVRKLRCSDAQHDPGGGGINVARVVGRLGGACRALYPAGGGTGDRLHRLLGEEGIVSIPVHVAADTRESFTVLEDESGEQYRFVLPGAPLRQHEWQACLDRIASITDPPDFLVASGSLPPGVPDDFYARLAQVAGARGSRVIIDSVAPALAAALEAGVYLVKPNLRELRDLAGRPLERESDWAEAAAEIVRSGGADIVALTLGHQGALLVNRQVHARASAIPVRIASAVGAGDSFLAGMVWSLASGQHLDEAFRFGVAAGTAALLTPGTGLSRKEDIFRLRQIVALDELPMPSWTKT